MFLARRIELHLLVMVKKIQSNRSRSDESFCREKPSLFVTSALCVQYLQTFDHPANLPKLYCDLSDAVSA